MQHDPAGELLVSRLPGVARQTEGVRGLDQSAGALYWRNRRGTPATRAEVDRITFLSPRFLAVFAFVHLAEALIERNRKGDRQRARRALELAESQDLRGALDATIASLKTRCSPGSPVGLTQRPM